MLILHFYKATIAFNETIATVGGKTDNIFTMEYAKGTNQVDLIIGNYL